MIKPRKRPSSGIRARAGLTPNPRSRFCARFIAKMRPWRKAVSGALPAIARAVDAIARALQQGGRLFYVGAGTSGRLAALDAAELPPTFGTPPRMVQAVIAGGRRALTHAVEGAEDNRAQGAKDLAARGLNAKDAVVGIAASGATPYVLGRSNSRRRKARSRLGSRQTRERR